MLMGYIVKEGILCSMTFFFSSGPAYRETDKINKMEKCYKQNNVSLNVVGCCSIWHFYGVLYLDMF